MTHPDSQTFLRELDQSWSERDRFAPRSMLRANAGARINHAASRISVFGQERVTAPRGLLSLI